MTVPLTVADIEAELADCRNVPTDERGTIWHARVDALLAQRARLAATEQQRAEHR